MATDLAHLRTRPAPACPLCRGPGRILYEGLGDRGGIVSGQWNFRQCERSVCGLVWLDPVPIEEDIGKAYRNYYTHNQPEPGAALMRDVCWAVWHSYLGVRFGYEQGVGRRWLRPFWILALLHPGGRAELDSAAMYLPAPRGKARVLDVGCGSGALLARMKALGWEVEGVEIDPTAAEAARARGVPVRVGTLEQQAFPDNHFDAVHSAHVLEHVHDPLGLLRESCRILKAGGTLVTITPNAGSWGHCRFGAAWLNMDAPRHLHLFSTATLRQAAEKSGLNVERLVTTARNAWVYGALSHSIRRTGRGDMSELGKPASLLRGIVYQLQQRWVLRRDEKAGDELLLLASKLAQE
jgi:2-polyprenyl-3-methyl-5-hydroxy-6-metoxy-1,4-benzoquinol methylase